MDTRLQIKLMIAALLFAASAFGQTHGVNLTWQWTQGTGGACSGFNVFRGTVSGGPYTQINSAPVACGATASYLDPASGLINSTTYFYVAATLGAGGAVSGYSNQTTVTFSLLPNPPSALQGVSQ